MNFFDYNIISISMKKEALYISVNTARATFLLHKLIVLHTRCQKQLSGVFGYTAVLNIFRNTGESPYFSNDYLRKLYL